MLIKLLKYLKTHLTFEKNYYLNFLTSNSFGYLNLMMEPLSWLVESKTSSSFKILNTLLKNSFPVSIFALANNFLILTNFCEYLRYGDKFYVLSRRNSKWKWIQKSITEEYNLYPHIWRLETSLLSFVLFTCTNTFCLHIQHVVQNI